MPYRRLCTALLYCALLAAGAARATDIIPLLVGDNLDEQGRQKPLATWKSQLLEEVERAAGVKFVLRRYPWARAELHARNGDGLILGLPRTPERERVLRYSDLAAVNTLWLVTRSDATFPFNGIADLRGKRVGIVRGFSYGEEFERAKESKLFLPDEDIASRGTRLLRLMLRRTDVVLVFQPGSQNAKTVEAEINHYMGERLQSIGAAANAGYAVLPTPLMTDSGVYFAIARDKDHGMIDRINAALARMRKPRPPN